MLVNRLMIRRCSMSSIEEEDESALSSDELIPQMEKPPLPLLYHQPSPSVLEWDSELSESEQELDDHHDRSVEEAANRALQSFIQSSSRTHQSSTNDPNVCSSPFSIHLYDEEDSMVTNLRDFKIEFEDNSMHRYPRQSSSSALFSSKGCISELRTLEDQLEAALASLTLTINDCSRVNLDCQPARLSDSSACSSGLGDEIPYHQPISLRSKLLDDCDSAFSESGSTEKMTVSNPDESLVYRSLISPIPETPLLVIDHDDSFAQHPSKILIRTYNDDGSTKSIFIDDSMFIRDILFALIHKNHRQPDVNYALIETLPDLHMERIFEDHQKLTEAILMWPTVSSNRLHFTQRSEKYSFLRSVNPLDQLLQTSDMEGNIYLKEKSRKSWKKFFCILRPSGLYFLPKGKSKKDLVCLAKFENVELFFGFDWKKKFKSPSDHCFALKHPLIQKKSSKYIKYMCVETKNEFDRWIRNIRIAKFGQQLNMNYNMMEKAMNIYRSSGRFAATRSETPIERQQQPVHDRRTPIPSNQYYTIHSHHEDDEENSPIKSPIYMDELRQRLERVLSDPPVQRPTLIPPPRLKPVHSSYLNIKNEGKPPIAIGSTPLPRKQIRTFGNLSYRAMNTNHRYPQEQMSKSFIVPSKQEDQRSTSSLSMNSKSDSFPLDETGFIPPSSTFSIQSKANPSFYPQPDLLSPTPRPVPPVPPRKSSIPRPYLKPPPPQRTSSNNLLLRHSPVTHF